MQVNPFNLMYISASLKCIDKHRGQDVCKKKKDKFVNSSWATLIEYIEQGDVDYSPSQ